MTINQQILKDLIQQSGLSQKQYATKHGIEYKQFNHWVTGYRNVSIRILQLMSFKDGKEIKFDYVIINL